MSKSKHIKLTEDELDRQEEERNKRMNIIGQNGNDGEHYETESKFTDTITVNGTSAIWVPKNYNLNVNNIHDLEDVKDILEAMQMTLSVYGEPNPNQQRLIDKGLFK